MEGIAHALVLYVALVVLFRIAGKRTLRDTNVFDLVLLLMISEATQDVLIGEDRSLTQALVVITTLVTLDVLCSYFKQFSPGFDRWLEGLPVVLVARGVPQRKRMKQSRVGESDILQAARETQGLERLDQIQWAVLERDGNISVVPKER